MKINRSGILITYKCNAVCRHCLYMSNPKKNSLMSIDDARHYFTEFAKLGLKGDTLHIAGGEPFIYYEHLLEIVKANCVHIRWSKYTLTQMDWCSRLNVRVLYS